MECGASVGAMVGMEGGSHGPESMVKKEARVCERGWRRSSQEALPHVWPFSSATGEEGPALAQWHLCVNMQHGV